MVTLRWPVRFGEGSGSVRLWIASAVLDRLEATDPPPPPIDLDAARLRFGDLASDWVAEIGTTSLYRGLASLRAGAVQPIVGCNLSGTPDNPSGRLDLTSRMAGFLARLPASPIPHSAGALLSIRAPLRIAPQAREPIAMNIPSHAATSGEFPPPSVEFPVTLAVELGRVSLPLSRLADLREGDVIELGRNPREPVELTSNGRLVARGELVQIDQELGVRLTRVFV